MLLAYLMELSNFFFVTPDSPILCEDSGAVIAWSMDNVHLGLSLVARVGRHTAPRSCSAATVEPTLIGCLKRPTLSCLLSHVLIVTKLPVDCLMDSSALVHADGLTFYSVCDHMPSNGTFPGCLVPLWSTTLPTTFLSEQMHTKVAFCGHMGPTGRLDVRLCRHATGAFSRQFQNTFQIHLYY